MVGGGWGEKKERERRKRQRSERAHGVWGFPDSACCRCCVLGHEWVGTGGHRRQQTEARLWEDLLE